MPNEPLPPAPPPPTVPPSPPIVNAVPDDDGPMLDELFTAGGYNPVTGISWDGQVGEGEAPSYDDGGSGPGADEGTPLPADPMGNNWSPVDNNCGTGAGGFQPGNTCAAGGGGAPSGPSAEKSVLSDIVKEVGPHPGSREIPYGRNVFAEDADGNSLLKQDVADQHNLTLQDISDAERSQVTRSSWDQGKDRKILNLLADNGRLTPVNYVGRGLAFDTPEASRTYVEKSFGSGWWKTRTDEKALPESFTDEKVTAERFSRIGSAAVMDPSRERNSHSVVMEIEKGKQAHRGYYLPYGEGEVILPRGQAYKVRDILHSVDDKGYHTYHVKLSHDTSVTTNALLPGADPTEGWAPVSDDPE